MNKAFLFDLNGTMIDDMHYHTKAWYSILNEELHADLSWEQVKKEMYGKNVELLVRVFGEGRFTVDEMNRISVGKEKQYQQSYINELKLIDGLHDFLKQAKKKDIKMAIGSAAILSNVDFVIDNLEIRDYFNALVSAEDVIKSKPDPETFLKAAEQLGVNPADCIVFEDAPKGVESAMRAGMPAVVITTMHTKEEFAQYNNVVAFIKDYHDPYLQQLLIEQP